MSRCKKCGLLLTYHGASDSKKRSEECNYCKEFSRQEFLGEKSFMNRIGDAQKIGVTVSGGKDSIYVWNWLVSKFGPDRVIAFNHNKVKAVHKMASDNIQKAKRILCSEVIIVDDFDFYPRFLENLKIYINNPKPGILRAVLCAGCRNGISNRMFEEAAKYNINTIVNGASYLELAPFKSHIMKELGNGSEIKGLLMGLAEDEGYLTEHNLQAIIKDQFNCHATNLSNKKTNTIDYIDFFHYFENNPDIIKSSVVSKLHWEHPVESDWHFDCIVEEFKQFFYLLEYGYSELDYKISEMVRYGLLDRDKSIKELEEGNNGILMGYERLKNKLIEFEFDNETIKAFENIYHEKKESLYVLN